MANEGKIVIRTCYKHKFRFVVLNQLSFENDMLECKFRRIEIYVCIITRHIRKTDFLSPFAVQKLFNIQADSKMVIEITDNLGTPINPDTFDLIVDFYGRSGSFYLNVEFAGEKRDATLTTSKVNKLK